MPTILKVGPCRFFFYAGDRGEPMHVHVEHENRIAKFWLNPIRLHKSGGFNRAQINRIQKIVEENSEKLVEAWNEYFGR
ncbi:MAG: DUF4160 domain-containing protein [Nitrospirales bacterium]|nr:DUF4160 domain-containing protein [Nitrospirales bacterium]